MNGSDSRRGRRDRATFLQRGGPPRIIAHRGLSGLLPENTLRAFDAAAAAGAEMVELDVTPSADGALMVIHDAHLDRTTDGCGPVAGLSRTGIARLDAGSWFDPGFAGERVPTLADVLDCLAGRCLVNVEVKQEAVGETTAGGVVERIIRCVHDHGMSGQVLISSFEPRALLQAREVDASIPRAVLYDEELQAGRDPREILDAYDACSFNLSRDQVTPAIVGACHAGDRLVLVYTVNETARMLELFELGVDGLFTDRADLGLELVSGGK